MLRKTLFFCVLIAALALVPRSASAQIDGLGVGPVVGVTNGTAIAAPNPVGLTTEFWLSDHQAASGLTSFALTEAGRSFWLLQANYLFHNFNAASVGEGHLGLYIGAGAQYTVVEAQTNRWALRGPTGVTYLLDSAPIDLFMEVAPTVTVTDPASLRFDGAIGFRYYLPV